MNVEYASAERRMVEYASGYGRAPEWARDLERRTGFTADEIVEAGQQNRLGELIFDENGELRRLPGFAHPTPKEAQGILDRQFRRSNMLGLTGAEARARVADLDRPASSDPRARQAWLAAKQRPASSDPAARSAWLESIR